MYAPVLSSQRTSRLGIKRLSLHICLATTLHRERSYLCPLDQTRPSEYLNSPLPLQPGRTSPPMAATTGEYTSGMPASHTRLWHLWYFHGSSVCVVGLLGYYGRFRLVDGAFRALKTGKHEQNWSLNNYLNYLGTCP